MSLTLNQFLLLVLTLAAVVVVTMLAMLFFQLRKTAKEGELTLKELRDLLLSLKQTNRKINSRIDEVGEIVEASKKTAVSLSEIAFFLSTKVVKPSSKYWPFLFPLIRLGWRQIRKKKRKEG
ncbi:MAG: hypothetical protein ACE5L7_00155 [Candidatus Aminicenantales bacterium]